MIGDQNLIAVDIVPVLPSWNDRFPGRWAGIQLYAGGRNITAHRVAGSSQTEERLYVDLLPIATWITANLRALANETTVPATIAVLDAHSTLDTWADDAIRRYDRNEDESFAERRDSLLRWNWRTRHFWHAADVGAILPPLGFVRSGDRLSLTWRREAVRTDSHIDFIEGSGRVDVPWSAWMEVANAIVQAAGEPRLDEAEPVPRWDDPWLSDWGHIAPGLETLRMRSGIDAGRSVMLEAAPDLLLAAAGDEILACERAAQNAPEGEVRLVPPGFGGNAADIGYRTAQQLRSTYDLGAHPLTDQALTGSARRSGVMLDFDLHPQGPSRLSMAGGRCPGQLATVSVAGEAHGAKRWEARMQAARGFCHALTDSGYRSVTGFAATRRPRKTPEAQRAGAFAAELLLPSAALRGLYREDPHWTDRPEAISRVFQDFGVGAHTLAYQCWNHGLMNSAAERDAIIAEFSPHAFA